ncbi:hypothetical protein [Shewanella woodyi]|uniref:hypothetical protein n=1 Tax=Shewanella woodyi TaxID=60961 RepID=UPI003747FFFC
MLTSERNIEVIDFSTINAFNKGQRESFEDLICVLARREKHEHGIDFQSNDGCGGMVV